MPVRTSPVALRIRIARFGSVTAADGGRGPPRHVARSECQSVVSFRTSASIFAFAVCLSEPTRLFAAAWSVRASARTASELSRLGSNAERVVGRTRSGEQLVGSFLAPAERAQ